MSVPNSDEVIITKGKADGYIFRAPKGTKFDDLKTPNVALPDTFVGLGYINDEGIVESFSMDSEEKKDMNGTTVKVVKTSRSKTYQFTLMQTSDDTLKVVYGDDNVITNSGLREVKDNANGAVDSLYCLWFVTGETETDIEYTRVFIPNGAVSEIGDVTWLGTDIKQYQVTIAAQPDAESNTAYMYTQTFKKSTTAGA